MQSAYEFTIRLRDEVSASMRSVGSGLDSMHGRIMRSKASWGQLGQQMIAFNQAAQAIQSANNALDSLTRPGVEFQSGLADLKAITGLADEQLKELGKSARQTAKEFGTDAARGVESYKLLLSQLGPELANTPEVLNQMSRSANYLAKTMGGDTVAATQVLTTAMNQFQVDLQNPIAAAAEMERFMNAMSASAKEGSAELPALQSALSVAGLASKTSNVSFEETLTYLQALDKAGRKAAEGGTAYRAVLGRLSRDEFLPPRTIEALQRAGIDMGVLSDQSLTLTDRLRPLKAIAGDTALMQQLFGEAHYASAIAMIHATDSAEEFTKKITGTNTTIDQAGIIMDTHAEKTKRLQAQLKDLGVSAFNASKRFLPFTAAAGQTLGLFTQIIPAMAFFRTLLIKSYQAMAVGARRLVVLNRATRNYNRALMSKSVLLRTVAAAKAVMGAASLALAGKIKVATAAKMAFNAAFLMSPLGWIAAGVGVAAGAYLLLRRRVDDVTAAQKALNNISNTAQHSIVSERVEVERLVRVLHDESTTKDQKEAAYKRLIQISPEYFGHLSLEEAQTNASTEAVERYIESLLKKAEVKAMEARLEDLARKELDIDSDSELDKVGFGRRLKAFAGSASETFHLNPFEAYRQRRERQGELLDEYRDQNRASAREQIEAERRVLLDALKGKYADDDKPVEGEIVLRNGLRTVEPVDEVEGEIVLRNGLRTVEPDDDQVSALRNNYRRGSADKEEEEEVEGVLSGRVGGITAGGGERATHININMGSLIETFSVHSKSVAESVDEIRDKVVEALMRSVNSVNAITRTA